MFKKLNEKLKYYKVQATNTVVREDGHYTTAKIKEDMIGYECVNKETGIVEFTSMRLPEVVFQADYLDKALESMLEEKLEEIDVEVTLEDVVPLDQMN